MRKQIPGETQVRYPGKQDIPRLTGLAPFVRQAGDSIRNGWVIEGRKLLDYLLVYVGSGGGDFQVGNQSFRVGPGDFTWVPPDTYVRMEGDPSNMRCAYIHFDLIFDSQRSRWDAYIPGGTLDLAPYRKLMHPPVKDPAINRLTGLIPGPHRHRAADLLIEICFEYHRVAESNHLYLSGLALQLISELLHADSNQTAARPKHWQILQNAETFIQSNLSRDLNVTSLAARSRLSTPHFRKLFREQFGISPVRMHRTARIKKGCELLVYSNMNISEAAFAMGFSTVHSFSKAFREVMGVSPSAYKQGHVPSEAVAGVHSRTGEVDRFTS